MSDSRPTHEMLADVFAKVCEVVEGKDASYDKAWQRLGWRGNVARVLGKGDRMRAMLWRTDWHMVGSDESVVDTAQDMIALLAMFIINYEAGREWGNADEFSGDPS